MFFFCVRLFLFHVRTADIGTQTPPIQHNILVKMSDDDDDDDDNSDEMKAIWICWLLRSIINGICKLIIFEFYVVLFSFTFRRFLLFSIFFFFHKSSWYLTPHTSSSYLYLLTFTRPTFVCVWTVACDTSIFITSEWYLTFCLQIVP